MAERLIELLDYYRVKSDKIEAERTEWLQQLNLIKQSIQNVHLKEREVLDKKIQIAEQQKALSDSHLILLDEKLNELKIIKDNEELKRANEKDQIKIAELASLSKETKYGTDPRNVLITDSRPKDSKKASLAVDKDADEKDKSEQWSSYVSKYKKSKNAPLGKQQGKIKTIFLPHEDVNKLKSEIQKLKEYKENQRKLYSQCLKAYQKEKEIKKEEIRLRKFDHENKLTELQGIVEKRSTQRDSICRDYFQERHRIKEKANPTVESFEERLKVTKEILIKKLDDEKLKLEREIAYQVETLEQHGKDYTDKFRNQAKRKEGKVNILKDQYIHLQKVYVENIKTLEIELESYNQREENIEFRRQRESTMFSEDILTLKKRVTDYESYIKKLKELVDRDKAEELIGELTQNDQRRTDLIEIRQEIQKLKDEVDHSRRIKV